MLFTRSFIASILLASLASALPLERRQGRGQKQGRPRLSGNRGVKKAPVMNTLNSTRIEMGDAANSTEVVGAAYFITNEEDGNFIVSADIVSDGQLVLRQALPAGGAGIRGDDGGQNNPAPLFSSGSVRVSAAQSLVATVNSGSNTLALFSINADDNAILEPVGQPVGSGGEFPVSVAFNSKGDKLCALNGGEINSVRCFSVDKQTGLAPLAGTARSLGLTQTTPATGAPGSLSHLIFSEDDKQLIVTAKGLPAGDGAQEQDGFVQVFDVAADGSLSAQPKSLDLPQGGNAPFGMAIVPKKNEVLVTDPAIGFSLFDLSGQADATAVEVDGQIAIGWASFSPKIGNFFLSDVATGIITEVNVGDNQNATIVKLGADSGTEDSDVATVGDKDFLYVLAGGATAVNVLSLDAPGQAKPIQTLDIAGPAAAAGLTINGINLQGMAVFVKQAANANRNNGNQAVVFGN
uniref:3-carboxymuconate cyclase n=1 Tax=Moniliophthora roreri TaxID=221103 RepID=A0A0W0EZP3_MONRR